MRRNTTNVRSLSVRRLDLNEGGLPPVSPTGLRFFAFALEVRKIIYTTNAIESLNAEVRKVVRIRGHFLSEEAATKLIYLALRKVQARWKNPPVFWQAATAQPAIRFEERFVVVAQ